MLGSIFLSFMMEDIVVLSNGMGGNSASSAHNCMASDEA